MDKDTILIFGASDHCRYAIDIIEKQGVFKIIGILDDNLECGADYGGYKILGKVFDLPDIVTTHSVNRGIIAIGDNFTRFKISEKIKRLVEKFVFISAIHPSVIIGKNSKIGEGSLLMAGVIVNNDTVIGQHCFLATKSSIDHDCSMAEYSSLSPGVTTGGNVRIGLCTAIGLGANILHGKSIGQHSVVGAGSLIVKNIGDNFVSYGVPAKEIRNRNQGDKYL
ncbi:acetyltransferase [Flavobacterium tegetincola]|uniref:acetyltransferase n=1 Tax=Flavobacterium tegetincola TaxID=150172 RepID=UPI00040C55F3|nr:acetyltransferase [Flavobacterium tegetincola]